MTITLKEYLVKRKMRQVELARKTGITITALNLYVNGWQPLPEKHLEPLAKNLGLTVDQLKKMTSF